VSAHIRPALMANPGAETIAQLAEGWQGLLGCWGRVCRVPRCKVYGRCTKGVVTYTGSALMGIYLAVFSFCASQVFVSTPSVHLTCLRKGLSAQHVGRRWLL